MNHDSRQYRFRSKRPKPSSNPPISDRSTTCSSWSHGFSNFLIFFLFSSRHVPSIIELALRLVSPGKAPSCKGASGEDRLNAFLLFIDSMISGIASAALYSVRSKE